MSRDHSPLSTITTSIYILKQNDLVVIFYCQNFRITVTKCFAPSSVFGKLKCNQNFPLHTSHSLSLHVLWFSVSTKWYMNDPLIIPGFTIITFYLNSHEQESLTFICSKIKKCARSTTVRNWIPVSANAPPLLDVACNTFAKWY